MEFKKYLSAVLAAALLIGVQVKATEETTQEKKLEEQLDKIVKEEAKLDTITNNSFVKNNQNAIYAIGGAILGTSTALFGAYVAKVCSEKRAINGLEKNVHATIVAYGLTKDGLTKGAEEANKKIKELQDKNAELDKEVDAKKIEANKKTVEANKAEITKLEAKVALLKDVEVVVDNEVANKTEIEKLEKSTKELADATAKLDKDKEKATIEANNKKLAEDKKALDTLKVKNVRLDALMTRIQPEITKLFNARNDGFSKKTNAILKDSFAKNLQKK